MVVNKKGGVMKKPKITSKFPTSVNVGGIIYKIIYTDKASDTDIEGQQAMWGQIDYWTRTIRVYQKNRTIEDIIQTLLHEMLHAISQEYQLNMEDKEVNLNTPSGEKETAFIEILSLVLFDTLRRNNWLKFF